MASRRELPAYKALLRLQHWVAAGAAVALRPAGGAAGHLVNAALHAVAARAGRLADPRMRSLRSVSHLASLWAGDRSSYKYRGRQVLFFSHAEPPLCLTWFDLRRGELALPLSVVLVRSVLSQSIVYSAVTSGLGCVYQLNTSCKFDTAIYR